MATKRVRLTDVQVTTSVFDSQTWNRGTPDPYVVFSSQRGTTGSREDYQRNNRNPTFAGPYILGLSGPRESEQVRLQLWDHDRGSGSSDDRMEDVVINFESEAAEGRKSWSLSAGGQVTLSWKITGRAAAPAPLPAAPTPKAEPLPSGQLRVLRVSAQGLLPRDGRSGKVDPYVLITGVSTEAQERWETQMNNVTPVWQSQVDLPYDPEGYRVEVWDQDFRGGDDLCGEGTLQVSLAGGSGESRLPLILGWRGRQLNAGEVTIQYEGRPLPLVSPAAAPAPPEPIPAAEPAPQEPTPAAAPPPPAVHTGPVVRREIRKMPLADQQRFVAALKKLWESPGGPQTSEYFRIAGYHGWPSDYCHHGQETFPGWHRGYLIELERALVKADRELGGDGNVALPYWDWSDLEVNGEVVPGIIRQNFPEIPDGFLNRNEAGNLGTRGFDRLNNDARTRQNIERARIPFQAEQCLSVAEHWMHASTRFNRQGYSVESPHNSIHMACGFPMTSIYYAAFTPIFFLHHCNVDRIYEKHVQMESRAECAQEFSRRQQQLSSQGEDNRYAQPLKPFRHPFEDRDLMPSDTFNTEKLGYLYDELPPTPAMMTRMAPVFAAFVKVNVLKLNRKSYMLHAFVVPKEDEGTWNCIGEPQDWPLSPNYAGCAAIFAGKGDECQNCQSRPPFSVLIEVQDTLRSLNLSRHKAGLRVMCEDENGDVCALEDTPVPKPVLVGPTFEDLDGSQISAGDGWAAAQEDGEVKNLQNVLQVLGYDPGQGDGKFGPKTELAVKNFQKYAGLKEDGIVGPKTKGVVMKGRKDMALDMEPVGHKTDAKVGRFYKGCTISFFLGSVPGYLNRDATLDTISKAFSQWADAMGITVKWTGSGLKADIIVCWDDLSISGEGVAGGVAVQGGVLAEATPSRLTLDSAERWLLPGQSAPEGREGRNLYAIVLHEVGHCIGLSHSSRPDDIMYPYYEPADDVVLSANDKARCICKVHAEQPQFCQPAKAPAPAVTPAAAAAKEEKAPLVANQGGGNAGYANQSSGQEKPKEGSSCCSLS